MVHSTIPSQRGTVCRQIDGGKELTQCRTGNRCHLGVSATNVNQLVCEHGTDLGWFEQR
jgi:hypothetical protein